MSFIKHIARYWKYPRNYPGIEFGWRTLISANSELSQNIQIGAGSSIIASNLGAGVRVFENSKITHSQLGENVTIKSGCEIASSRFEKQIVIGHSAYVVGSKIGAYSYINWRSAISNTEIGKFCSIASDVITGAGFHPTNFVSTSPVFFSTGAACGTTFAEKNHFEECLPTYIGHDVWIGARVFIGDGISIGNGAVIGAGAVVVKDVPPYAIVAGVPAKIIRYRFDEQTIEALMRSDWWNWPEDKLRQTQPEFVELDINCFLQKTDPL